MSANRVPPHLAGDTSSANLLTDARLADIAGRDRGSLWMPIAARLAREVQASRKLRADLLALPKPFDAANHRHETGFAAGYNAARQEIHRLIEEADRG